MSYRSLSAMPTDMWVAHFKQQAEDGKAAIHDLKGKSRPAGIYSKKGIVIIEGKSKSDSKSTPLEVVEPTQQVASQAVSDMKHNISNAPAQTLSQSVRRQKRPKATEKQIKSKTRKVQDILS